MLELPNFGHMTTSTIQFESRDEILLVTSCFFFKYIYFKKAWVGIFADTTKIVTFFTQTIFKG